MEKCNIKKSQCFDLDYPEYENVENAFQANEIANIKEKSYFIFNNSVFQTMPNSYFNIPDSDTGFWRMDLINQ